MKFLICLLAVFTMVVATTIEEYQASCPDGKNHTMLAYPGVGEKCGNNSVHGVSDEEKEEILRIHNQYRNFVASGQEMRGNPGPQPKAANMQIMEWDDGIGEVSQRWADQCTFGHDECRSDPRFHEVMNQVGQNAAMEYSSEANWTKPVSMWYDEVKDMDRGLVDFYTFDSVYGHYSQVVWYNSNKVGCGRSTYQEDGWYITLYVCNYAFPGNFKGRMIYQEGEPRSACPDSPRDMNYPALCTPENP